MFEQNATQEQMILGHKVLIDWKAEATEMREIIRLCGIKIAKLEAILAGQQLCKWPTCQSNEYQDKLADQVKNELIGD